MLKKNNRFFPAIIVLLVVTLLVSIALGPVRISLSEMAGGIRHFFSGEEPANIHEAVFLQLRLPRVLLCAITGAVLAASGVLMQGLFRNPIVEPGLVGTSAGAAFGASIVFVLGPVMSPAFKNSIGPFLVPLFAFAGASLATFIIYLLSKNAKRVSIISLLLIGIAINAVGMSGTGFMSYIARDPQARSITFWNLGNFSGASWTQVYIVAAVTAIVFIIILFYAKQLNALLLGEEEANYLGVDTDKLKRRMMILNTAMVAVATSFVGVISFIGLIVPHMLRVLIGSDNKKILPASMIGGAILLSAADILARMVLPNGEVPVGIITSLLCAPVFIILLKKFNILDQKGGGNA